MFFCELLGEKTKSLENFVEKYFKRKVFAGEWW
jgi:hypothetical protein